MNDAEWIMKQQIEIKDKEIERLRELLVRCVPLIPQHWELGPNGKMTAKELEKEVSDESPIPPRSQ